MAAPTSAPRPAPDRCPLCDGPNDCAVAAGRPPSDCWCMQARVSPEALARLPADQRGLRCLCPVCARPSDAPPAPLDAPNA